MIFPRLMFRYTDRQGRIFDYDIFDGKKHPLTTLSARRREAQEELDTLPADHPHHEMTVDFLTQFIEQADRILVEGDVVFERFGEAEDEEGAKAAS